MSNPQEKIKTIEKSFDGLNSLMGFCIAEDFEDLKDFGQIFETVAKNIYKDFKVCFFSKEKDNVEIHSSVGIQFSGYIKTTCKDLGNSEYSIESVLIKGIPKTGGIVFKSLNVPAVEDKVMEKLKLKCHGCKKEQEYDTDSEAWKDGWDKVKRMADGKEAFFCGDCASAPFIIGSEER